MKSALLIIDVQRDLCEGRDGAFEADLVIGRINVLSQRARRSGAPVIFVQHEGKNGYLEFGTEGWKLPPSLISQEGDLFVRKTTPDSFHRTNLEALLKEQGVGEIVVCGMHTEFCVDTSTRRALALGFPVVLVADAHTTQGNVYLTPSQVIQHHNATLTNISSFGPKARAVLTSEVRFGA
jgi:nicotinamidase-related amidase